MQFIFAISLLFFAIGRIVGHLLLAIGVFVWRLTAAQIAARSTAKSTRKEPPILR